MNLASEDLQSYVQLCHSVEPRCQSPGTFTSHLFSINFLFDFIASPDLAPLFNCISTQCIAQCNAHLDRQIELVIQRV